MLIFNYMQTRRGFQTVWVAAVLVAVMGAFVDRLIPELFHSTALRNYQAKGWIDEIQSPVLLVLFGITSLSLGCFAIKSWIDVLLFRKLGIDRSIYCLFANLSLMPFMLDQVHSGLGYSLLMAGATLYGVCLTLAKTSPTLSDFFQ